jgi:CubicO group peptidase (beta-lactamase class C family)
MMDTAVLKRHLGLLGEFVDQQFVALGLPGLLIGVVHDQELIAVEARGSADLAANRPMTADRLFRAASITKTLTAAMMFRLRDDGLLALDDPLERFLPEFAAVRERGGRRRDVTIRRLLTHHSGLTTETPLPSWSAAQFPSRDEVLAALPQTELVIAADSAAKYSNLGFGLLGEVAARLRGTDYFSALSAELLQPLGMQDAVFVPDAAQQARLARGYLPLVWSDQPLEAPQRHLNGVAACGQLYAGLDDLARWTMLQFRDGANRRHDDPLTAAALREMRSVQYREPDGSIGYGMTWRETVESGRSYFGHGGGIHGYTSYLLFAPEQRIGVICLGTLWPHGGLLGLASQIADLLIDGRPAPLRSAVLPAATAAAEQRPLPAEVDAWLGLYEALPGVYALLARRGNTLQLEPTALNAYRLHVPARLEAAADGDGLILAGGRSSGERLRFVTLADGRPGFTLSGFQYRRLTP